MIDDHRTAPSPFPARTISAIPETQRIFKGRRPAHVCFPPSIYCHVIFSSRYFPHPLRKTSHGGKAIQRIQRTFHLSWLFVGRYRLGRGVSFLRSFWKGTLSVAGSLRVSSRSVESRTERKIRYRREGARERVYCRRFRCLFLHVCMHWEAIGRVCQRDSDELLERLPAPSAKLNANFGGVAVHWCLLERWGAHPRTYCSLRACDDVDGKHRPLIRDPEK